MGPTNRLQLVRMRRPPVTDTMRSYSQADSSIVWSGTEHPSRMDYHSSNRMGVGCFFPEEGRLLPVGEYVHVQ